MPTKEAKKRKEASTAFTGAGRAELAAKGRRARRPRGLPPAALTPDEMAQLVAEAIAETERRSRARWGRS